MTENADTIAEKFHCTEAMRAQLNQCLHYWELTDTDYMTEIDAMEARGELPCRSKREGMQRLEQLKQTLFTL